MASFILWLICICLANVCAGYECRQYGNCEECIHHKCFWTSERLFPCRGIDDIDAEAYTTCPVVHPLAPVPSDRVSVASESKSRDNTDPWEVAFLVVCGIAVFVVLYLIGSGRLVSYIRYRRMGYQIVGPNGNRERCYTALEIDVSSPPNPIESGNSSLSMETFPLIDVDDQV